MKQMINDKSKLMVFLKEMLIRTLRLEDITPQDIDDNAPLFKEGLGLDSLDALEIVIALEKDFNIFIPDEHVGREAFASISALASYVQIQSNRTEQESKLSHDMR
jgi:acyl carrier protein